MLYKDISIIEKCKNIWIQSIVGGINVVENNELFVLEDVSLDFYLDEKIESRFRN